MSPGDAADRLGRAVQAAIEARRAALLQGAQSIQEAAHDAIGRDGGPDGSWPGLAEATLTSKRQLHQVGRVSPQDQLYATGTLRESYSVDNTDPDRPTVGSSDPVAAYHETGAGDLPPRPVLGPIGHQKGEEIARKVGEAVAEAFRAEMER